jgi:hypothetical protein
MNPSQTALRTPSPQACEPETSLATHPANRVVVVLQDVSQEALLASRILDLAQKRGLGVLLVGIVPDLSTQSDAELRRQLVRVAAFLKDAASAQRDMPVEIRMDGGARWLDAVRYLVQPGDLLACCSDWNVGRLQRPLNDVLGAGLRMPVYVFGDLGAPRLDRKQGLARFTGWVASLASVGGFCIVSARIVLATQGAAQSVLLLAALAVEIGVIYFVNSLSTRF